MMPGHKILFRTRSQKRRWPRCWFQETVRIDRQLRDQVVIFEQAEEWILGLTRGVTRREFGFPVRHAQRIELPLMTSGEG